MCGIVAILLANKDAWVAGDIWEALSLLQHRGQDAAGIVSCSRGRLYQCKDNGMVRDVFSAAQLASLYGNMGLGHVRYPTAGSSSASEAQPFYVNSPYGIVMGHNGNLTNSTELEDFLDATALRHINTTSDSEVLLNVLAYELQKTGKRRINHEDVFDAVTKVLETCHGGYAVTTMINGYGIVSFRDPSGIRPLIFGQRPAAAPGSGTDYCVTSESVVLDFLEFSVVRDVEPGECLIHTLDGQVFSRRCAPASQTTLSPCVFEFVYFARPDSVIDGISVYNARLTMGEALAKKVMKEYPQLEIDVVIPVPDTSRVAALQCSYLLKKVYREGFIKNRYVGRTFIMPGQAERRKSVRRKLNAMRSEFEGKRVLLVDDSIVRGTTSREIINMAREAGALKVYFASAAPPIRHPNVYGIDMPSREELVAHDKDDAQIAKEIGADVVIYQDLADLIASCAVHSSAQRPVTTFDTSVFDGHYVAGDVTAAYLEGLEAMRKDGAKAKRLVETDGVEAPGLHNARK